MLLIHGARSVVFDLASKLIDEVSGSPTNSEGSGLRRIDPQPGDEVRINGRIHRVVRRDDGIVWCLSGNRRYQMLLSRWQKWCKAYGESAAMAASQRG